MEAELSALRAELVSQRKATESLANETRLMKSQLNSQLANLTHMLMLMSAAAGTNSESGSSKTKEAAEANGPSPDSDRGASSNDPSPMYRNRSKSGRERGRRMSLNALTTAGV